MECLLYISLVRPILEYASIVWDPKTQVKVSLCKKWLRICSHQWDLDYYTLLHMFQLPSLASRHDYLRLLSPYKITFQFPSSIPAPSSVSYLTSHKTADFLTYTRVYLIDISNIMLFVYPLHFMHKLYLKSFCMCIVCSMTEKKARD